MMNNLVLGEHMIHDIYITLKQTNIWPFALLQINFCKQIIMYIFLLPRKPVSITQLLLTKVFWWLFLKSSSCTVKNGFRKSENRQMLLNQNSRPNVKFYTFSIQASSQSNWTYIGLLFHYIFHICPLEWDCSFIYNAPRDTVFMCIIIF